jgi:broad specificity phosphatase PhoE
VREILSTHAGKEVAIFCHGGVIRVILALLLGWPLTQFGTVEIEYASLTQVACTPPTAKLQLLNFTPWRELNVRAAAPVQGLPAPGAAALRAS